VGCWASAIAGAIAAIASDMQNIRLSKLTEKNLEKIECRMQKLPLLVRLSTVCAWIRRVIELMIAIAIIAAGQGIT
jgi:hypothetical protein